MLDVARTAEPPGARGAAINRIAAEAPGAIEAMLPDGSITLPRLLRHRARTMGAALALREKDCGVWHRYTWSHYYQRARLFAFGLWSLGLKAGDRIAIAGENTPEWYYADLGAQMIGAQVVGIYPTNPWPELQYIVRHCGARLVVTGDQEQTDKVIEALAHDGGLPAVMAIACVDMKGMRAYDRPDLMSFDALCDRGAAYAADRPGAEEELDRTIENAAPDDTCILVYTSGTTGPPKGAMLSHRNLVYSAYHYALATGTLGHRFESVCYLPLCHVAERCYSMVLQLVLGGVVNFAESIDTVATNIREIGPTFFIGVPRIYEKLQQNFFFKLGDSHPAQRAVANWCMARGRALSDRRQAGQEGAVDRLERRLLDGLVFANLRRHLGLDRSRHRLCAGASISPEMLRFFDIIGLPVAQGYGMTESGGVSFIQSGKHMRIGGCGLAIGGTEWRLDDDGEILLRSRGIFQGYFQDEAATAATLGADRWLRTGDIVEVLDNGEIAVVDRKKAIIITSGGKNIAPSEMENALKDSPFIREAIVVGEARKFLGALIQIDYDEVGRWARDRTLAYTNYKSLAQLSDVVELIDAIVRETNKKFARVENVRKFVILEKELDHDDGELTATQKVRRGAINKKFARELELIYGKDAR
ncbi:AMP-dependent synthetase/ligase [Chelatococcus reniformis]|uniref:Long-chain-fatty-acid--CoA ligase n=1 Tax=Chelatococcus reniformis TaxID=1494448 RepID=A0A916XHY7_9HYPH|nr:AMP-binding protein [Chelatococcus reniformis]GGC74795.1 long-chain-fatty-acid--CoA ligase [Chelatococcus reniformis]